MGTMYILYRSVGPAVSYKVCTTVCKYVSMYGEARGGEVRYERRVIIMFLMRTVHKLVLHFDRAFRLSLQ